jgi:hypothetical protein
MGVQGLDDKGKELLERHRRGGAGLALAVRPSAFARSLLPALAKAVTRSLSAKASRRRSSGESFASAVNLTLAASGVVSRLITEI